MPMSVSAISNGVNHGLRGGTKPPKSRSISLANPIVLRCATLTGLQALPQAGPLVIGTNRLRSIAMTDPVPDVTPEFQRGWEAALKAAKIWHESQAKKALIQARRSRFPKNLEREAEVHQRSAEMITTLSPDDV